MLEHMGDYEATRRAFGGPFYYRQTCDLVITAVYHARDESQTIIAMKKALLRLDRHMSPA